MQITVSLIVDIAASTDINQIEQVVQEAGLHAMREAIGKAVRAVEEQSKTCPYCGSEVVRSEGTDRRVILTKYGRVVLALRRLRCSACRRGKPRRRRLCWSRLRHRCANNGRSSEKANLQRSSSGQRCCG